MGTIAEELIEKGVRKGERRGMRKGVRKGRVQMVLYLVRTGVLSVEQATQTLDNFARKGAITEEDATAGCQELSA